MKYLSVFMNTGVFLEASQAPAIVRLKQGTTRPDIHCLILRVKEELYHLCITSIFLGCSCFKVYLSQIENKIKLKAKCVRDQDANQNFISRPIAYHLRMTFLITDISS